MYVALVHTDSRAGVGGTECTQTLVLESSKKTEFRVHALGLFQGFLEFDSYLPRT